MRVMRTRRVFSSLGARRGRAQEEASQGVGSDLGRRQGLRMGMGRVGLQRRARRLREARVGKGVARGGGEGVVVEAGGPPLKPGR
jgi:hypothetical protein